MSQDKPLSSQVAEEQNFHLLFGGVLNLVQNRSKIVDRTETVVHEDQLLKPL